jgi:UDP:flavonoid glycosyltransferase YjiC (YdhE family)
VKNGKRPVILLVAEAVTLAHFGRMATLAKALDPGAYKIVIAADPRYMALEAGLDKVFHPIRSISSAEFAAALNRGEPLYSVETLTRYVEDDLELLDCIRPDLVVGDFRLSLAVSASLRKVPYANVVNAYWSPYADTSYPVPDIPITQILGIRPAQALFDIIRPLVFALHARPFNQVRKRFGLPPLRQDLRAVYTWADYTLYADVPEVVPTINLPAHHRYLGPILWSPEIPLPEWWSSVPRDKPMVFISMGSSGDASLLPQAVDALSQLEITILVATAGKITLTEIPANAYVTDYLPLGTIVPSAGMVISNGGSLTTYQAMTNGLPIIGLCSNLDQLLNMNAVKRLGAGIALRSTRISAVDLRNHAVHILENPSYARAAGEASRLVAKSDAKQRFREFLKEVLH